MKLRLLLAVALSCVPALAVPVSPITNPHVTFVDNTGSPCSGCTLNTYAAGTTNPLATYVDSTGTGQNTNPITLDVAGGANIWLGSAAYKFILKDTSGTVIWTVDNVQGYISACSTSGCTFTGPISGTTATFQTVTATTTFTGPIGQTAPDLGTFTTVKAATVNNVAYPTTFSELQAAVTACASNPCTIGIRTTIAVPSNYTIPSNVTLSFANAAQLQPATGITLTVIGPIDASPVQIFGGAGSIAGLIAVRPEWLGTSATLLQAINAANSAGATVDLGWGTYTSGDFGSGISRSNLTIQGIKTPQANQSITGTTPATGFVAGTGSVVTGNVSLIGSNLTFSDFGVDVTGDCNANSALQVTPNGINQPMLYSVHARNISTVACTAAQGGEGFHTHSLLFEHITGLVEENIQTYNGFYGNVIKATNATLTNITDALSASSCSIVKSDDVFSYAEHITVDGLTQLNCGDPFTLDTFGATLDDVTVTNIHTEGMLNGAIIGHVAPDPGTGNPGKIDHVTISGGNILDTSGDNAVAFQDGSRHVDISHLNLDGGTGINGIVLETLGPGESSVEDISISNYTAGAAAGYGVYEFSSDGQASNIHCSAVATACVTSSGDGTHIGLLSVSHISSDGTVLHAFPNSYVRYADQDAWQTPTFANGWHNFGSPNQTAQFRLDRNSVNLSGLIVPGSAAQVMTLPTGYRPLASVRLIADAFTGSVYDSCEVLVEANGNVSVVNYSTCATNYVSLDGLTFPIQ